MTKDNPVTIDIVELSQKISLFVITEDQVKIITDIAQELKTKKGGPIMLVLNSLIKVTPPEKVREVEGEIVKEIQDNPEVTK